MLDAVFYNANIHNFYKTNAVQKRQLKVLFATTISNWETPNHLYNCFI